MTEDPGAQIVWCIATPDSPHPADRKSRRCSFHQAEYRAAMERFRAAANYYASGRGTNPGPRDDYERAIVYTPPDQIWTGIDATERARIRNQLAAESAAALFLARIAANPQSIYDLDPAGFADQVAEFLTVRSRTVAILESLGNEPTTVATFNPPGSPSGDADTDHDEDPDTDEDGG